MMAPSSLLRRGARLLIPVAREPSSSSSLSSSSPLPIRFRILQPRDPRTAGIFIREKKKKELDIQSTILKREKQLAHRCSASTSRSRPCEPTPGGSIQAKRTPCSSPSDSIGYSSSLVSR